MDYYSATKRNEISSFVKTWIDLESVIQSEVSQKGKQKMMHILTHICEIQKNGTDEHICRNRDGDVENVCVDTCRGGVGDKWGDQD